MAKKDEVKYASLFAKLYNEGAEALKAGDQGLVERQLKRRWEGAHDNAAGDVLSRKLDINKELAKLGACDINKVIVMRKEIDDLEHSMEIIEETYQEVFGVEFPLPAEEPAEA